jgi:hypothetical protein
MCQIGIFELTRFSHKIVKKIVKVAWYPKSASC